MCKKLSKLQAKSLTLIIKIQFGDQKCKREKKKLSQTNERET